MRLESRFNLGQMVWPIHQAPRQTKVPCETCGGLGKFEVVPGKFSLCPDAGYGQPYGQRCELGKKLKHWMDLWRVQDPSPVGRIGFEAFHDPPRFKSHGDGVYHHDRVDEERYMIENTGIGSGQIHEAYNLFASEEEARDECDRRNVGSEAYLYSERGQRVSVVEGTAQRLSKPEKETEPTVPTKPS